MKFTSLLLTSFCAIAVYAAPAANTARGATEVAKVLVPSGADALAHQAVPRTQLEEPDEKHSDEVDLPEEGKKPVHPAHNDKGWSTEARKRESLTHADEPDEQHSDEVHTPEHHHEHSGKGHDEKHSDTVHTHEGSSNGP